jgi:3-oxoacyl-[acyl-carrier-protein] synthase II
MAPERRRVAVTGLGAVTPLGEDPGSTWEGMLAGRSGVGPITLFDTEGYRTTIAAEVSGWEPEKHFDKREVRRVDRFAQFFLVAVRQAMEQAGISYLEDDPAAARAGVVVGAGFGGMGSFIDRSSPSPTAGPIGSAPQESPESSPTWQQVWPLSSTTSLGPSPVS